MVKKFLSKNRNNILTILFLAILVVGIYFSFTSYSVIDTDSDKQFYEQLSCQEPQDCYDLALDIGFPKSEMDEQLKNLTLICENNVCGVQPK